MICPECGYENNPSRSFCMKCGYSLSDESNEEFEAEVMEMSTKDILLILSDQLDLYSDKEIRILEREKSRRSFDMDVYDSVNEIITSTRKEESELKELEKDIMLEKEMIRDKIQTMKARGLTEYYEYTSIEICDSSDGSLDTEDLLEQMNELALEGWRLVVGFTNELGVNSSSVGFGGFTSGVNATMDQNIFIFERKVRID